MAVPRPLLGAAAGFLATIPMTAVMTALYPLLPAGQQYPLPPSQITARATAEVGVQHDIDPDEHRALALLNHFGFGTVSGALFAPLARLVPLSPALSGIVWGLLVWLSSYMGWVPALGVLPKASHEPRGRNVLMIGAHIVWGVSLGILVKRFDRYAE